MSMTDIAEMTVDTESGDDSGQFVSVVHVGDSPVTTVKVQQEQTNNSNSVMQNGGTVTLTNDNETGR